MDVNGVQTHIQGSPLENKVGTIHMDARLVYELFLPEFMGLYFINTFVKFPYTAAGWKLEKKFQNKEKILRWPLNKLYL